MSLKDRTVINIAGDAHFYEGPSSLRPGTKNKELGAGTYEIRVDDYETAPKDLNVVGYLWVEDIVPAEYYVMKKVPGFPVELEDDRAMSYRKNEEDPQEWGGPIYFKVWAQNKLETSDTVNNKLIPIVSEF